MVIQLDGMIEDIASYIRWHVRAAVANLQRADGEIRTVFHGPPMEFLEPVFNILAEDGGIDAVLGNGQPVTVPVLLQVALEEGASNPALGASGKCEAIHLIGVRNAPALCPRFVALVEPGQQANLSFSSASDDFGLSPHNNSGAADTLEWWKDEFIKGLVDRALDRHHPSSRDSEQARDLVEKAVYAADQIDKHVAARHGAWRVLSRIWFDAGQKCSFGELVSLACGFPPLEDSSLDAQLQGKTLDELTERMVDSGFKSTIDQLNERADETESGMLEQLLAYLQQKCGVPTVLSRAPPFYYGPSDGANVTTPPGWWSFLTVERLRHLLDGGDEAPPADAALLLICKDPLLPRVGATPVVVASLVTLSVYDNGNENAPDEIIVKRETARVLPEHWNLKVTKGTGTPATGDNVTVEYELTDAHIPMHRSPVKYTVEGPGVKKATLRVVSMATWEPGIVVYSRTASKMTLPKKTRGKADNVSFETSLTLSGEGRHYFDVYARPGVQVNPRAEGSGADGSVDPERHSAIAMVSDSLYGFEAEASGDCFYQVRITRGPGMEPEICRIYLTCDEVAAEDCGSEFERLIRMNRQRGAGRASIDVHINRQLRSADLQGWMLAKDQADDSYRPFVLAPDYASSWRARDWSTGAAQETIVSSGRFLHDPRPARVEMAPPPKFTETRRAILRRIRGTDENGLIEAAPLGQWTATDPEFAQLVEDYVQSYNEWLEASPETAAWSDIGVVAGFEADSATLSQEPDAILVTPFHPVRLAWHCVAQRALYQSQGKSPCPAASILDPDAIPDALLLPMRTAAGGLKFQVFFSVECSSDYWAILWNGSRLDRLSQASKAPFDKEFGVLVGGISSGFSMSQVGRALGDVAEIFSAKPVLSVLVTSAGGQNNACNDGILEWCRERLGEIDDASLPLRSMGSQFVQILDERSLSTRPEDAEVSNLAEDTGNCARWMGKGDGTIRPDLAIIAQLETSSPSNEKVINRSPIGPGGLVRHRVRQQLSGGNGAFLSESRMAAPRAPTGDGLLDKTAAALVRYENLGETRFGYIFAPSVHAIRAALDKADYAAVSSSAIDPACFLGGWLEDTYLWDYELPSYSHRSGDSNGYYLLSKVKDLDRETLGAVLSKLPGCGALPSASVDQVILEVARRGIPTVKGLSRGDSGASGDLGLFVAARLIQDDFRVTSNSGSLLPVLEASDSTMQVSLLIPVDPFRGYIDDLGRALGRESYRRPDFVVAGLLVSESRVTCRLTPVEVKYRGGSDPMPTASCKEALQQAKAFSDFILALKAKGEDPALLMWKLAFQHLACSMLGFGLRVYSQQVTVANVAETWASLHVRIMESVLSEELDLEVDPVGRLVVIDGSKSSGPLDLDADGFAECITLNRTDAGAIANGDPSAVYAGMKDRVGHWRLLPGLATIKIEELQLGVVGIGVADAPASFLHVPVSGPQRAQSIDLPSGNLETEPAHNAGEAVAKAIANPGPDPCGGIDLLIGTTIDGFHAETRRLNLSDTNLNQLNVGVVGDLGTGKTQLLKSLVYQTVTSAQQNRGITPRFLIFDYKKDYSSEEFVKATGARIVKPQHLPINLFDVSGAGNTIAPWLDRYKFFADVLDKIFSGMGPVQRQNLKSAVKQAYEDALAAGQQATIYDVHAKYSALIGNKPDSPFAILDDLVDMEMFSREPVSGDAFDKFLDGVVVISLDALGQDDRTKNMLVAIMLNVFYEHMLRIPKRPFVGVSPQLRVVDSFLMVDEADNIMRYEFDVLRKVLLQGREFGVGVILASQYLRHFKSGATDYREPLLTWLIHKVPNITPQELGALGLVGDVTRLADRIKSLAIHTCLFKTFDVGGDVVRGTPFYELVKKGETPW
jgi:DNA phosphorothioation-dependent restriction protein DptH